MARANPSCRHPIHLLHPPHPWPLPEEADGQSPPQRTAAAGRASLMASMLSLSGALSRGATTDSGAAAPGCSGGGSPRRRGEKVGRAGLRGGPVRMGSGQMHPDRPVAAVVSPLVGAAGAGFSGSRPAGGCGVGRLRQWVLLGRRSVVAPRFGAVAPAGDSGGTSGYGEARHAADLGSGIKFCSRGR